MTEQRSEPVADGDELAPLVTSRLTSSRQVSKRTRIGDPNGILTISGFVVLVVLALAPFFTNLVTLGRLQLVLIYVCVSIGLNLTMGFAGEFAVAQPAIMGAAAYAAGVLSVQEHWSPWLTLPAAIVFGTAIGTLISLPGLRLVGWSLGITTFMAAIVFPDVIGLAGTWTGGSNGLSGIGSLPGVGFVLGTSTKEFEIVLLVAALCFLFSTNIATSSWGIIVRGLRDAAPAAESCGVNLQIVKIGVAVASSLPVSLAGWLLAHTSGLNLSLIIIASVVIGGSGTIWGPVIGTAVVEAVSLWIGPFSNYNTLLVGGTILVLAAAAPQGLAELRGLFSRVLAARLPALRAKLRRHPIPAGEEQSSAGRTVDTYSTSKDSRATREFDLEPGDPSGRTALSESQHRFFSDSDSPLYSACALTKRFGGKLVLDGVDLTVHPGEIVGIVGPNGSGKTTLLNLITGHLVTDSGTASFNGTSTVGLAPHQIGSMGIRRSFQVPRLIGELCASDNIRLGLLGGKHQRILGSVLRFPAYRKVTRADGERVDAVCDLIGLHGDQLTAPAGSLPLGIRRVVEVGRAVCSGAGLVCLDEPAAGLAGVELDRLRSVIRRVANSGSGVVLIEHNLAFVHGLCDKVLEMRSGKLYPAARSTAVHQTTSESVQTTVTP
jgi:branched-chain amino acid transport system permease protein